jgi:hypothetical protein
MSKDHRISSSDLVVQAIYTRIKFWKSFRPVGPETTWMIPTAFYYYVSFLKELQDENGENYNPTAVLYGCIIWRDSKRKIQIKSI